MASCFFFKASNVLVSAPACMGYFFHYNSDFENLAEAKGKDTLGTFTKRRK